MGRRCLSKPRIPHGHCPPLCHVHALVYEFNETYPASRFQLSSTPILHSLELQSNETDGVPCHIPAALTPTYPYSASLTPRHSTHHVHPPKRCVLSCPVATPLIVLQRYRGLPRGLSGPGLGCSQICQPRVLHEREGDAARWCHARRVCAAVRAGLRGAGVESVGLSLRCRRVPTSRRLLMSPVGTSNVSEYPCSPPNKSGCIHSSPTVAPYLLADDNGLVSSGARALSNPRARGQSPISTAAAPRDREDVGGSGHTRPAAEVVYDGRRSPLSRLVSFHDSSEADE